MRPQLVLGLAVLIVSTPPTTGDSSMTLARLDLAEAQGVTDTRERLRLAPAQRDAVHAEMRTMLQSLNRIIHGLAASDLVMVEEAARASGPGAALKPELEQTLPPHFQQLGRKVHQRFDQLADAVKAHASRDDVMKRLAALTSYCVTCHDAYRLDEAK